MLRARRPLRRLSLLLAATVVVAGLSACGSDKPPTTAASLQATPAANQADVSVDAPVTLNVDKGSFRYVNVSSNEGALDGTFGDKKASWTSTEALLPGMTYTVHAEYADKAGVRGHSDYSFTTQGANKVFSAKISPNDREVGVGMPILIKLSEPLPQAQHDAFEKRFTITSTPPVTGDFHWFSDKEVHWRPKEYWPANAQVEVDAKLSGFRTPSGAWGAKDVATKFHTGVARVSVVDVDTHTMQVFENGQVVRQIPVSTGRDKYPTRGGIHVVSDKEPTIQMDSSAIGIDPGSPGGYNETVHWSVRISNTGEFVHAAPWSRGSQGNDNVSHGCVNVSNTDGKWFYARAIVGDVVEIRNSPKQLEPTNGIGDWQIPWEQWAN